LLKETISVGKPFLELFLDLFMNNAFAFIEFTKPFSNP